MTTLFRLVSLLFCLFSSPVSFAADDDDAQAARQSKTAATEQHDGNAVSNTAAVKTQILQTVSRPLEITAQGSVLDFAPLLTVRQQYLAAQAQLDGANARFRETEFNLQRTRQLHSQDIVATRRLQEQQALWQSDKASLSAINYQQQAILATSRMQWGELLTHWFTQTNDANIKAFLQGSNQLISITLPANHAIDNAPERIYIDGQGKRDQATTATLIANAPQVDPVSLSRRLFYQLHGRSMPIGSHLTAWLADSKQLSSGVLIPENAVVWHLGQAYVFVKTPDGRFSRRALEQFSPTPGGYVELQALRAGDAVVTSGAQTLLSHDLKNLIPTEDDD